MRSLGLADAHYVRYTTEPHGISRGDYIQHPLINCYGKEYEKAHIYTYVYQSVQSSHSVMSDAFRPHELQHARPPCPSPTPGAYPNSCPLSQ